MASQNQYLVVKHRDGQKEHIAGYVGVVRLQATPIIGRKGGALSSNGIGMTWGLKQRRGWPWLNNIVQWRTSVQGIHYI